MALISLIPEVLIQIGVRNLLDRLNILDRIDVGVVVIHVDSNLLESALGEQEPLDTSKCSHRRIVSLLDKRQLFSLALVKAAFDGIGLSQSLKREDKYLRSVCLCYLRNRDNGSYFIS
jgi:hypothetical protein